MSSSGSSPSFEFKPDMDGANSLKRTRSGRRKTHDAGQAGKRRAQREDSMKPPGDKPETSQKKANEAPAKGLRRSSRLAKEWIKELQRQEPSAAPQCKMKKARTEPGQAKSDKTLYEVDGIVDSDIDPETFVHSYKVRWKDYTSEHDSWVLKVDLHNCQQAINAFEEQQKKQKKKKKRICAV